jgi:hypothetical protein
VNSLDRIRWIPLSPNLDARGALVAVEAESTVPFPIRRVYYMFDLKDGRGGHAHRDTEQLLVALSGSCDVVLSDGREERRFRCDDPGRGLYIAPMVFIRVESIAPGSVILVIASTHYDKSRSIRSWEAYLEEVR